MMARFGRRFGDDGMATAELAAVLPVLVVVVLAGFAAITVSDRQVRAQDAAAAVARAEARGEPAAAVRLFALTAPAGATFTVARGDGRVTVTVRATLRPFGGVIGSYTVSERAVAAIEPGQ